MAKQRILIIDDDVELTKAIHIRLEQANYKVTIAHCGQDGLNKAFKEKPDLIILDLMLPDKDGLDVCKELNENDECWRIPVIILSARSESFDIRLTKVMGAREYITKPFQYDGLIAKIKKLLEE